MKARWRRASSIVEIVGDSQSLEQAFARSTRAAQKFNQQTTGGGAGMALAAHLRKQADAVRGITKAEEDLIKVRSKRASSIGPFRVAGVGLGAGVGLFAATQVDTGARRRHSRRPARQRSRPKAESRTWWPRLTSGNLVGAVEALVRVPKTLEELGITAV